eukprot:NODE_285_length_10753_cov_0.438615.p2 type:complete len:460 gc:universal NODE_285_length_10753_cov_0.438615:9926-8547(-)
MQEIPTNQKLKAVQFPGLVNNPEKAIEMLGGKEKFIQNQETYLSLSEDFFCSKVPAQIKKSNYLLVEVDEKSDVKIIGHIPTIIHFESLIDYKVSVPRDNNMEGLRKGVDECDIDEIRKFDFANHQFHSEFLPPPIFSNKLYPTDYAYKGQKYDKSKRSFWPKVPQIDFGLEDVVIPSELPSEEYERHVALLSKDLQNLLQRSVQIFSSRPIVTSVSLANLLGIEASDSDSNFRYIKGKLLPLITYFVPKGPFRFCYCKLGYDPRLHAQEAVKYQVLDATTRKYKLRKFVKDKPSHIFDGIRLNSYMNIQICDIEDRELTNLLDEIPYSNTFSPFSGFMSLRDFAAMREVFRRRYANIALGESNLIPRNMEEARSLELKIKGFTKKSQSDILPEEPTITEATDHDEESLNEFDNADDIGIPEIEFDYDVIVGTDDFERNNIELADLSKQVDSMLEHMNF